MKLLQIKPSKRFYRITMNNQEYVVPKNEVSTLLLTEFCFYMDATTIKTEIFLSHLIRQYHNSIRLVVFLQATLLHLSTLESSEHTKELEEMFQIAQDWNFFLQEIFKALDMKIPNSF